MGDVVTDRKLTAVPPASGLPRNEHDARVRHLKLTGALIREEDILDQVQTCRESWRAAYETKPIGTAGWMCLLTAQVGAAAEHVASLAAVGHSDRQSRGARQALIRAVALALETERVLAMAEDEA